MNGTVPLIETVWWKEASRLQISSEYEQMCSDAADALPGKNDALSQHLRILLSAYVFVNALRERGQGGSSCVSLRHRFANSGIAIQSGVPMTTAGGAVAGGGCAFAVPATQHAQTHAL